MMQLTSQERLQVDSLKGGLKPVFNSTQASSKVLGTALLELSNEYLNVLENVNEHSKETS